MNSKIKELLNIETPIFQGAMAWIADADLAGAVSEAGGLGIIAGGNAPKEVVVEEIRKIKTMTEKPFAVNIMLHSPFVDDIVDAVIEEGVKVVTTGAGSPAKYMDRFHEAGIKVIPVVPSVALAKRMEKLGVDAVIAEGMEAGGHVGKLTTMPLVPQIVDAVNIPVIAAGGIGDGRGMAAAFMLGAEGVQIGTRFVVAKEANVHQNYKDMVLKARDIDAVVTAEHFGHAVRVLKNNLTRSFAKAEREAFQQEDPDLTIFDELGKGAMKAAVIDGDVKNGSVMAGQIAGLISKEQTVKEIIDELVEESKKVVNEQVARFNA